MQVVTQTNLVEFPLLSRGKVRDIYEIENDILLIVTTDRMSAFDVIMAEPIPYKGVVLNQITLFWMRKFSHLVKNHLIEHEVSRFPEALRGYASVLEGRSVLVRRAKPLPIECIVRGNITGSGWKDYEKTGMVSGHCLPEGLRESDKLETPLFTPSTKAELGQHDENITRDQAMHMVGRDLFAKVEDISLAIFNEGREYAATRGIIIADTKFEFGMVDDELYLINEVLTPDSSRFWPQRGCPPGKPPPTLDTQFTPHWPDTQDRDNTPPPPALPARVSASTTTQCRVPVSFIDG